LLFLLSITFLYAVLVEFSKQRFFRQAGYWTMKSVSGMIWIIFRQSAPAAICSKIECHEKRCISFIHVEFWRLYAFYRLQFVSQIIRRR
jgi:hypothetical protein